MSDAHFPSPPQHREKLIDLSTGKTVNTGEALVNHAEIPAPFSPSAAQDEATKSESSQDATLHISPIGGNWEVESEAATLGQAGSKIEAEELAITLAEQMGAEKVKVHTSEGAVEKEISLRPEQRADMSK